VPNQQLVLPEGTSDKSYRVIIKPPVNLEQITHARLVDENGNERVLYGGSLTLGGPVNGKLGLRTSTAGNKLPRCALTEQFIIRLTHRRGGNREIDADFQVKLPIQLSPIRFGTLPNYGSYQFHLNPGEASNIPQMCAGGDPANRNWTWVNDPDPLPAGLGMQVNNDGSNRITGTPQTNSYRGQGLIQLSQGVSQVTTRVSLEVGVRYFEQFGDTPLCGSQIDLEPGGFYECEMPQPRNYPSYTWTINSGQLPPGLQIMQRDQTKWYITGTIDANTPVRTFPVNFQISSSQQALDRRQVNFVVGIPIKVWTQNAQLRPNITDNTDADNEERASLILNRINNGEFDVVALQEVFDNTQRDQLEIGHSRLTAQNPGYRLLWGPATEESGLCEESGLALLVKNKPGPLRDDSQPFVHRYSPRFEEPTHSGSEFPISCGMKLPIPIPNRTSQQQFCEWDDCLAYKGFTITKAFFGENTNEYLWIVHTHLQASEADGQREQQRELIRRRQLQMIIDEIAAPRYRTNPVLLLGDLNVTASSSNSSEYQKLFAAGSPLRGWQDPLQQQFVSSAGSAAIAAGGDLTPPYTWDQTRNAYAYFWDDINVARNPPPYDSNRPLVRIIPRMERNARMRLDHIWLRQGTTFVLRMESVRMEDQSPITEMCQEFPITNQQELVCYLSDHFGLSARFRLLRLD
jgi:endonuclease/exonuclease/phosphatase family metal-dependent hydrolase